MVKSRDLGTLLDFVKTMFGLVVAITMLATNHFSSPLSIPQASIFFKKIELKLTKGPILGDFMKMLTRMPIQLQVPGDQDLP